MKKMLTYFFKLIYLLISWFIITYTCSGDINVNLFCISIFTYSGGVAFDSLFYLYESFDANTILRLPVIILSAISFVLNLLTTICSLVISKFIIIPFDKDLNKYIIVFEDKVNNGFAILYPGLSNWQLDLAKIMLCVMLFGIFSLLPACLIEIDAYIRIRNDKYDNNNIKRK